MIDNLLKCVYIYDDKIVVFFNLKGDSQNGTTAEISLEQTNNGLGSLQGANLLPTSPPGGIAAATPVKKRNNEKVKKFILIWKISKKQRKKLKYTSFFILNIIVIFETL